MFTYGLLSDRLHIRCQWIALIVNSALTVFFEGAFFKDRLICTPLRASSCCIEIWTGVARPIQMVFGIPFPTISTVCDNTSMVQKGPSVPTAVHFKPTESYGHERLCSGVVFLGV